MASYSNLSECSISTVSADVSILSHLLPFRQPLSAHPPSFVIACFVSMVIHAFLVYLLVVVVTDRTASIGPAPSIKPPLLVSLVSLPTPTTTSQEGLDREAVPEEPHADLPAQQFQALPDRAPNIERSSEPEPVLLSKNQEIPAVEAPEEKYPAADVPLSFDVKTADHISPDIVSIPEFEAGIVLTQKNQIFIGPETPAGKSFTTGISPSLDLNAANRIAEEIGRASMTEFEFQDLREVYLMNRLGIIKTPCPDCVTAYADTESEVQSLRLNGLLAIPFLLKDLITDSGYTWYSQERIARQMDLGRLKDQERREFMSNIMNELTFDPP